MACLGFGAFAAYLYLSALLGGAAAAAILCAGCGAISAAILGASAWRRRSARLRRAARTPAPATPNSSASLLEDLIAAGGLGEQKNLLAAIELGRKMKPLELVALALVGGFLAARKLGE